jgi:hypothetical protein
MIGQRSAKSGHVSFYFSVKKTPQALTSRVVQAGTGDDSTVKACLIKD